MSNGDEELTDEAKESDHDGDGDDEKDDVSPSPALQIELMVRGEPDNGGVQSESGNFPQDDTEEDDVMNFHFK